MSEKVAIMAFEFGNSGQDDSLNAGPSNFRISMIARKIRLEEMRLGNDPFLAVQGKIGLNVPASRVDLQVDRASRMTHIEHIEMMYDVCIARFKKLGIKRVILVGHPILLSYVNHCVVNSTWKGDGITIDHQYDKLMEDVLYDKSRENGDWWTKNPVAYVVHTADALVIRTFAPIVDAIKAILPWKSS